MHYSILVKKSTFIVIKKSSAPSNNTNQTKPRSRTEIRSPSSNPPQQRKAWLGPIRAHAAWNRAGSRCDGGSITFLAACSSSTPSPITTYTTFLPNLCIMRSKQLSFPAKKQNKQGGRKEGGGDGQKGTSGEREVVFTWLAACSSSLPSPTTTYVTLVPKRDTIRSKQLSFPGDKHMASTSVLWRSDGDEQIIHLEISKWEFLRRHTSLPASWHRMLHESGTLNDRMVDGWVLIGTEMFGRVMDFVSAVGGVIQCGHLFLLLSISHSLFMKCFLSWFFRVMEVYLPASYLGFKPARLQDFTLEGQYYTSYVAKAIQARPGTSLVPPYRGTKLNSFGCNISIY
jgi:hypothetical protein